MYQIYIYILFKFIIFDKFGNVGKCFQCLNIYFNVFFGKAVAIFLLIVSYRDK